jgi:hypothetical protein
MRYLIPIIFCLQLISNPSSINELEINWDNEKNKINSDKSVVIDNTGEIHFYIGGMGEDKLFHFCTIHNIYEEVSIGE